MAADRLNDRALAEAIREKFALDDDNDQDILDQHVSRVWKDQTPHRSPGTMSPCPPLPSRRRTTTHDSGMLSDGALSIGTKIFLLQFSRIFSNIFSIYLFIFGHISFEGGHSIRHSKSMPEQSSSSRKLTNKWPSMNTDSGISLFSADTLMKYKDSR